MTQHSYQNTKSYQLLFSGPDFVSSIEDEDFVYFFFREEAVEYMNCGKVRIIKR